MLFNVSVAKNMVTKKVKMNANLKMLVKTSVYTVAVTMNLGTVNLKKIPPIGIAQTVPTAITLSTKPTQKVTQQRVFIAHLLYNKQNLS